MKKLISILLILMVFITGCGKKEVAKTEQELKAEIRAELEAKQKEKKEEANQNVQELGENVYILDGILMPSYPPFGTGIKLNKSIEITREWNDKTYTFDKVYFSGDKIYNYVERQNFIFNDPVITISDDCVIPVKIKFDFSGFVEADGVIEYGHIWTDKYEILKVNGSSDLVDKSGKPYPFGEVKAHQDIRDKNALLDLIYKKYNVYASREVMEKNIKTVYADYTGDGNDDVMCFLQDVTKGFYKVTFITADKGALEIIPFDGDDTRPVSHFTFYDGKFIHYIFEHSGNGMSGKVESFYIYDGNKIKETGANLTIEGSEAQRPTSKFPEGYITQITSKTNLDTAEDFTRFDHDITQTGSHEWQIKKHYVFNENTKMFDIETLIDTTKDNAVSSNTQTSFYDPASIKVGQNIGGLKVSKIDYKKGNSIMLGLKGSINVKGKLRGGFNEMDGMNEFYFTPNNTILDKPIQYTFNSGWTGKVNNFEGAVNVDGLLDKQVQNYLIEGHELNVNTTLSGFELAYKDESEGARGVSFSSCDIIADEPWIVYVESGQGKKPKLENETFATEKGDVAVHYDEYRCVVIPMYDTVNSNKTDTTRIDFGGENPKKFKFTVLGELQDVKINYVANMGDEGEWKKLDTISNQTVEISTDMPNDMSSVTVYGRYHEGEGYYKDVKFTLDDMRDLSAYDIITF